MLIKNPHISDVGVLTNYKDHQYALGILHDVAERVSYLMKINRFKVGMLVEFYPRDKKLLGMNVNRGKKIMLRLRDPCDERRFLNREDVISTMLHELTHNLFGPHDHRFYSKLDELCRKQMVFQQRGMVDAFLGRGRTLGTGAKTKKAGTVVRQSKGQRLGGRLVGHKLPRELAALAAERRSCDNRWCASENDDINDSILVINNEPEIIDLT